MERKRTVIVPPLSDDVIVDKGLRLKVEDGLLKGEITVNCQLASATSCDAVIGRLGKLNGNGVDITFKLTNSGGDVFVIEDTALARGTVPVAGEFRPIGIAGRREIALANERLADSLVTTHEGGHLLGLGHQADVTRSVMMRATNFFSLDRLRPIESQRLIDAYRGN